MKRYNLLTTILFCLFIGSMGLISSLAPDKGFSEMENRNLHPLPELTAKRLSTGRFMTEAEKYASDQFAFRDGWVALKALGEVISGKKENNGIYFAQEETLIRRVAEPVCPFMVIFAVAVSQVLLRCRVEVASPSVPSGNSAICSCSTA